MPCFFCPLSHSPHGLCFSHRCFCIVLACAPFWRFLFHRPGLTFLHAVTFHFAALWVLRLFTFVCFVVLVCVGLFPLFLFLARLVGFSLLLSCCLTHALFPCVALCLFISGFSFCAIAHLLLSVFAISVRVHTLSFCLSWCLLFRFLCRPCFHASHFCVFRLILCVLKCLVDFVDFVPCLVVLLSRLVPVRIFTRSDI